MRGGGRTGGVVIGQVDGLDEGKVGEQEPAPGGDHRVLGLDVPVAQPGRVGLLERLQHEGGVLMSGVRARGSGGQRRTFRS